jgi:hypothetical protein
LTKETTLAVKAQHSTSRKPCTYKHAELIRVCDKAGQFLGYAAKPEKLWEYGNWGLPNTYYHVTCNEQTGEWNCTCRGNAEFHATCKHIVAARELNEIRLGVHKVEVVEAPAEEIAPVVEEKKVRKPRTYKYNAPTSVAAMEQLRAELDRTRSVGKREALVALFAGMADESGAIRIEDRQWCYDADIKAVFEVVEVVPNSATEMPEECPLVAEDLSLFVEPVQADELPELPLIEEEVLDNEPFEDEEFSEDVAREWTEQEIAQIRSAAKTPVVAAPVATPQAPKYANAPLNRSGRGYQGFQFWR